MRLARRAFFAACWSAFGACVYWIADVAGNARQSYSGRTAR